MKKQITLMMITITMMLVIVGTIFALTMTRNVPTSGTGSFPVIYTVSGSGQWGASIQDSVTGGCTFPDGTSTYKSVMLSTDGNSKQITLNAPSSGTCTFTGDYKFGTDSTIVFGTSSITIGSGGTDCPSGQTKCSDNVCRINCNTCTPQCSGKVCGLDGCGGFCGTCTSIQTCNNGVCINLPTNTTCDTCLDLGYVCGPVTNNCGNILQCGSCSSNKTCDSSGQCVSESNFNLNFLTQEAFKLGSFSITWLMIIIAIAIFLIIISVLKK